MGNIFNIGVQVFTADSESTVQFWILDFDLRFHTSLWGDQALFNTTRPILSYLWACLLFVGTLDDGFTQSQSERKKSAWGAHRWVCCLDTGFSCLLLYYLHMYLDQANTPWWSCTASSSKQQQILIKPMLFSSAIIFCCHLQYVPQASQDFQGVLSCHIEATAKPDNWPSQSWISNHRKQHHTSKQSH